MANIQDLWLVLISVGVAMMASCVAASAGGKAHFWVTGGLISLGAGIWALQSIGMLVFELSIPMSYDIPITLLSLLIAVLVSGFALCTTNAALKKRTVELTESNTLLQRQMEERSHAEDAMRESEERFRAAFEQAGVGMGLRADRRMGIEDRLRPEQGVAAAGIPAVADVGEPLAAPVPAEEPARNGYRGAGR